MLILVLTVVLMLFSLHIGKSPELCARLLHRVPREKLIGDIRTHIRVPGGLFSVSIQDPSGAIVYGAVNAAPHQVNGQACVRWKPPAVEGEYRAILWNQKNRSTQRFFGAEAFSTFLSKTCTKVAQFSFIVVV